MTHGTSHDLTGLGFSSRSVLMTALAAASLFTAGIASAGPTDANHRFERVGMTYADAAAILPLPGAARVLIAQRSGDLRLWSADGRANELITHIDVATSCSGEGILDMTWHPAAVGSLLYVSYISNATPKKFTVGMMELTGSQVTTPLANIWSANASTTCVNLGGGLGFTMDGFLLVGVGDQGNSAAASQATQNIGKVLRLNSDGTLPPDNPLPGRPLWALGVRNPLAIATDYVSGDSYFLDVNPTGKDELNVLVRQGNFGWPTGSGTLGAPPLLDPVKDWATPIGPVSLVLYRGNNFKGSIPGTAILAANDGRIYSEDWNGLSPPTTTEITMYAAGPGEPGSFRDIGALPDGYIYAIAGDGTLWRIRNTASTLNEPSSHESVVPLMLKKDIFNQIVFDVEKKEDVQWYAVYSGNVNDLNATGYTHDLAIDCHVTPMAAPCVDPAVSGTGPANAAWYTFGSPAGVVPSIQPPPAALNPPQYFLLTAQNGRGETRTGQDSGGVEDPGGNQVFGCPCPAGLAESPRIDDCREPFTLAEAIQSATPIGPVTFDQTWDCDVTLVDLSEGWCYWCHVLAPDLDALYDDYKDSGFTLITLVSEGYSGRGEVASLSTIQHWDEDPCCYPWPSCSSVPSCAPSSNPILLDEGRRVMNRYFNSSGSCNGWPQSIVFDADGVQTDVICGADPAAARAAVERNLRAAGYIP